MRADSTVEERLWIPVRDVLASIVPLEFPPQVNLSGTCDDVLGCICTSLSANAAILAETLVHEAAHTTLHILTDGTHYWEAGDGGRLYRSPWRKVCARSQAWFTEYSRFSPSASFGQPCLRARRQGNSVNWEVIV